MSTLKTLALLQQEEQLSDLRLLKLRVQAQKATTPDDFIAMIDSLMRAKRQSTERLLEIVDWNEQAGKEVTANE